MGTYIHTTNTNTHTYTITHTQTHAHTYIDTYIHTYIRSIFCRNKKEEVKGSCDPRKLSLLMHDYLSLGGNKYDLVVDFDVLRESENTGNHKLSSVT